MIYHGVNSQDYDTLSDLPETVKNAVEDLRPHRKDFDSIVVTGMSGVIVGVPVALRLKKPVVVLRKPNDDSHHGVRFINDNELGRRALFLDDFVAGGETKQRVTGKVEEQGTRVVGSYLYRDRDLDLP